MLYDLPNFLACIIFLAWGCRQYHVPPMIALFLLGSCCVPFLMNGILFPMEYMSDQKLYIGSATSFRAFDFMSMYHVVSVKLSSALLALVPVPLLTTENGLGFANKFLFLAFFFYLFQKKIFTQQSLWFFLLFPSLVLFSSLGLRDLLVAILMVLSVIAFLDKDVRMLVLAMALLLLIKNQNFYMCAAFMMVYAFLFWGGIFSWRRFIVLEIVAIFAGVILFYHFIDMFNLIRGAYYRENFLDLNTLQYIATPLDLLAAVPHSLLSFFLRPWPWEAVKPLQYLQSIENIAVLVTLLVFTAMAARRHMTKTLIWVVFLLACMTIYGLIMVNWGTSARYRFPLILTYVIGLLYDVFRQPKIHQPKMIAP